MFDISGIFAYNIVYGYMCHKIIRKGNPFFQCKQKRRDRTYGIAVDEDGEHRKIRRMSRGRHVVNKRLKTGSNFGTEASCYVIKYLITVCTER